MPEMFRLQNCLGLVQPHADAEAAFVAANQTGPQGVVLLALLSPVLDEIVGDITVVALGRLLRALVIAA